MRGDLKVKRIKLSLCSGGCCPIVEITEKEVTISDDYNGKVRLTKAEAKMLAEKIMELEMKLD